MPKHEPADRDRISGPGRDFPAEQRDTESAIRLWHRKASEVGGPPPLNTFDFSRLTGEWGYRFLISGDQFVDAIERVGQISAAVRKFKSAYLFEKVVFVCLALGVEAAVFLVYGVRFARLLGLPEQPRSKTPLFHQLPARYQPVFVEGYGDAIRDLAPVRLSGTVMHQRKLEFHRAAFMPIQGANSVRPLIFGSFNYRIVPQEAALDGCRTPSHRSGARSGTEHLNLRTR